MSETVKSLKAEGVSVDLGGTRIIDAVDFEVNPGEVVGLIGPNGAGKSTLLRALLGLVPLSEGTVTLGDDNLADLPPKSRARALAYAPQGAPIHWPLTVERLVELGRVPHLSPFADPGPEDLAAVEAALAATETTHLRHRIATSLSGGERASVMLARAIAVGAPCLLADEPVAALDPYHQIEVMEILEALAREGRAIVVVLHDLTLAMRHCVRVCLMDKGRMVTSGAPRDVLTPDNLDNVYRVRAALGEHEGETFLVPWKRTSGDAPSD